ncbi:MAG TPA: hypothetical protein VFU65_08325, partial [Actinocrinis sp.]|nr:hypothetical protein [Actinocrinis sp.]
MPDGRSHPAGSKGEQAQMPTLRNVISTLDQNGREAMGPGVLLFHYPDPNILNGSLITVESNHF